MPCTTSVDWQAWRRLKQICSCLSQCSTRLQHGGHPTVPLTAVKILFDSPDLLDLNSWQPSLSNHRETCNLFKPKSEHESSASEPGYLRWPCGHFVRLARNAGVRCLVQASFAHASCETARNFLQMLRNPKPCFHSPSSFDREASAEFAVGFWAV